MKEEMILGLQEHEEGGETLPRRTSHSDALHALSPSPIAEPGEISP